LEGEEVLEEERDLVGVQVVQVGAAQAVVVEQEGEMEAAAELVIEEPEDNLEEVSN